MLLSSHMGELIGKTLVLEPSGYEIFSKNGLFMLDSHIRRYPALAPFLGWVEFRE